MNLSGWESKMTQRGRVHGDWLVAHQNDTDVSPVLANTYYDADRVFQQIADYTGDSSFLPAAAAAEHVYRDRYVIPNDGAVPGYWLFTTGLRMDYQRTADQVSKDTAILLSNRQYARDSTPLEWTVSIDRSREVAYAILSYIDTEAMGGPVRPRRVDLVNQAYGHLDQWFVTQSWRGTQSQFSPFMVALTAHALIRDWEQTQDSRLIPALRTAADYLWADAWDPGTQAMLYQLNPDSPEGGGRSTAGAPDLNLLISPMYAWLWKQTQEQQFADRGDALFDGAVAGAFFGGAKQFNQCYWWSFDHVLWRGTTPPPPPPDTTAPTVSLQIPPLRRKTTVTLTAIASDNVAVTRVEFYVNGVLLGTDTTAPYTANWHIPAAARSYVLQAMAYDAAGNVGASAAVTVTP